MTNKYKIRKNDTGFIHLPVHQEKQLILKDFRNSTSHPK